ncbi:MULTISPECIES: DUF6314 family protein [Bosea]|uniref:DUF6314 family protein n=1 Tax=Bosea TaxID=85413 RepID=UPI00286B1536|nr:MULTISPECIES: DUF6314 family protein [Bosea]
MRAFHGRWRVRRRILDARTSKVTRFEGTALISPERFEENGILHYDGQTFHARRLYRLVFRERVVDVHFEDGRFFITLIVATAQNVQHVCGDDRYRGRFIFAQNDSWTESWSVLGPRKSYKTLARYWRAELKGPIEEIRRQSLSG